MKLNTIFHQTLLAACALLSLGAAGSALAGNEGLGGAITYTDANGLTPVASPPYAGGYVVHTFKASGSLVLPSAITGDVLVVGGGGGGGGSTGGGGGAGGFLYHAGAAISGGSTPISIGAGGAGGNQGAPYRGTNGGNSAFGSITAVGGGGGGSNYPNGSFTVPSTGGSGGGGSGNSSEAGAAGTTGQGNVGGAAGTWGGVNYPAGGGGGAGAVGSNGSDFGGGAGGKGLGNSIAGIKTYYAGGGGGGVYQGSGGNFGGGGGSGGGGSGGANGLSANNATAYTGGGGGGQGQNSAAQAGSGGSGIVIVRYPYADSAPVLVELTAPTDNQVILTGSTISATAKVLGGTPNYAVTYHYKLTTDSSYTSTAAVGPFDSTSGFEQTFGPLPVGLYEFYATATDSASNTANSTPTVTFRVITAASVSGWWDDPATWGGAAVPTGADDVIIGSNVTVTVPTGVAAVCNNLTLSPLSGSTSIWLEDASSSLTAGSVRVEQSTSSSMTSMIDVGTGTFTAGSLTLGNASATNGSSRHTGLLIATGHATISGGLTTYSDAARIIFSDEGTLNLGGSVTQYGSNGAAGGKMTFTASTGTVTYDASDAQTVAGLSYHNLTLDGGSAKIMGAGVNVVGRLAIAPTGSAFAQLADGTNLSIRELAFGPSGQVKGTWGPSASTANNQSDIYFDATTDGMLSVALDTSASANDLLSFGWDTYVGLIDEENKTVKLYVPLTTDLTQVYPTCIVSQGANVWPASDGYAGFTMLNLTVTYTITAQDFSTKTYQVTVEPTAVLWSDNFDVADTTNLDSSPTASRLSGTLAGSVSLKSAAAQQTIAGGQLSMIKPAGPTGRVRFHDSTGGWHNWAVEPEGEQILAAGGIRVEFDWTTIDTTTDDWIAFNIGHSGSSAGEPGYRIADPTTDYGILLRGNGGMHRFDNGAGTDTGLFTAGADAKHVALDFFFTSFDDGSPVTARISVDGTPVDVYSFTWDGNFGALYMELETCMTGMKIDNYTVSTLPSVTTNPYQTWAGVGGQAFSALNGEGLANGLAWLLGAADPSAGNTVASLPLSAHGTNGLTLHFQRVHDLGTAKLYLEYSSDLSTWNAPGILVPADLDGAGTLGADISYAVTRGSATDEITLTIPNAHATAGRLFVRLAASEN